MENKKLILSLIRSDVINNKLLSWLRSIGLDGMENYIIDLDYRIFELIGFDITNDNLRDSVFEKYMAIVDKAVELEIYELQKKETLEVIAEDIYSKLLNYKMTL